MSDETPKNPSSPQGVPNKQPSLGKGILARVADYYCEWVGLKSMGEDVKEHIKVERQGRFFASMFFVLALAIVGGCQLRGCYDESKISDVSALASSNAVVVTTIGSQFIRDFNEFPISRYTC